MENERCYSTESPFPPLNGLRLYSMRFCPYSQRVRLVLAAKGIEYETININIKRKPEWYNQIDNQGLVPCLQLDETRTLHDSIVICEYLDETHPEPKLFAKDPYEKACQKMLIDGFQRVVALLFKSLKFKDKEAFNEIFKILDTYQTTLGEDAFFSGKEPGIVDYMIWPWFERFESLKSITNNVLEKERFLSLLKWRTRMIGLGPVKVTASKKTQLIEFYKVSALTIREPDYDVGLPKPAEEEKTEVEVVEAEKAETEAKTEQTEA